MKKKIIVLIIVSIISNSLFAGFGAGIKADKQIVYKTVGKAKLKLHIFYPPNHKDSNKSPVIIFFFGGGWSCGTAKQFYNQAQYLASRGMVAISAEYRTSNKYKTSPKECVKDGKSAIRYIRIHAKELGIDPKKIVGAGGSAGGHIAAACATLSRYDEKNEDLTISSKPNALVLYNPVYDNGPDGYGYERVKEYYKEFSPMHNLSKNTPPTIVFFGTNDKHVPVATAKKYQKIMKKLKCRSELYLYKNQQHGFFNYGRSPNNKIYIDLVKKVDTFLVSLGYLQGKSTIEEFEKNKK